MPVPTAKKLLKYGWKIKLYSMDTAFLYPKGGEIMAVHSGGKIGKAAKTLASNKSSKIKNQCR